MPEIVYMLCAVMSSVCAYLLFRGYRHGGQKLLLWTSLSFALFAANNIFLFFDLAIYPELNLHGPLWRNVLGAVSGFLLLFGLIWELT